MKKLIVLAGLVLTSNGWAVDHSNLELDSILESAKKTNKIIIVDHGWLNSSIGSTIIQNL